MGFKLKLKTRSSDVVQDYCEKCGQFGHTHRECGMNITCYKCGKVGHHGRNCTEDIRHESVAVQSAKEQGQYKAEDALWGEARKKTGNEDIEDWDERAAADRAAEDKQDPTEKDYEAREKRKYSLVLSPEEELAKMKKEAKRRKKEEKAKRELEDRRILEEHRERLKALEEKATKTDGDGDRDRDRDRDTRADESRPKEPTREERLRAEKERLAEEELKKRELEKEKVDSHLSRVLRSKVKKQGDSYVMPGWAGVRADKRLYLSVERDGEPLESWDVSEHPYYLIGKNHNIVDFCMEHPSTSRVHLAITHNPAKGATYATDLKSQWGTKVDNKKCTPHQPVLLSIGSTVKVGGSSRSLVLKVRHC